MQKEKGEMNLLDSLIVLWVICRDICNICWIMIYILWIFIGMIMKMLLFIFLRVKYIFGPQRLPFVPNRSLTFQMSHLDPALIFIFIKTYIIYYFIGFTRKSRIPILANTKCFFKQKESNWVQDDFLEIWWIILLQWELFQCFCATSRRKTNTEYIPLTGELKNIILKNIEYKQN